MNVSVANTRLFLGNIPKSKTKEEILEELKKHAGDFAGSFEPFYLLFALRVLVPLSYVFLQLSL